MIIDQIGSKGETRDSYDLIVIGSGPSGLSLANELKDTEITLAVIESGKLKTDETHDKLRKTISEGIVIRENSRERVFGGASTTWSGLSSPLDDIDYESRHYVANSGWPISKDEMVLYYKAAAERYHFPEIDLYTGNGFKTIKNTSDMQLNMHVISEKVFLAKESALNFGNAFKNIFKMENCDLFLDATATKLIKSTHDGQVTGVEVISSSGAKSTIQSKVIVLAAGGIENPRLLLQSDLGNEYDQVGRYMMNHPKNNFGYIKLKKPVQDSPYYFGCLLDGNAGYAGLRLSEDVQRDKRVLNSYVRLEPLFPWTDNIGVESLTTLVKSTKFIMSNFAKFNKGKIVSLRDYSETGDDSELQCSRKGMLYWLKLMKYILSNPIPVLSYLYYRLLPGAVPSIKKVRLRNFMEMAPLADNKVVLGEEKDLYGVPVPVVIHSPSDLDKYSLKILHVELMKEIEKSGVGILVSELDDTAFSWPIDQDASHHLGTTRMGIDEEKSVVDTSLKLHRVENVFVVGGSVFPTSSCVNPTFTMVALSIRLAEHLKNKIFNTGQEPKYERV